MVPSPLRPPSSTSWRFVVVSVVWSAALVAGFVALMVHATRPGDVADGAAVWPADSAVVRDAGVTVVVFAHPRCPCTRATVAELEKVLRRTGARAQLWYLQPKDVDEDWSTSPLLERARAIAGVRVFADVDGKEAARFGAVTSGHVVAYDNDGVRVFSGGITGSRGHEGDNVGAERLVDVIGGGAAAGAHVYGCGLVADRGADAAR